VTSPQRGQLRQPAAADLTIWQCTMPTLSQRLGSFPSKSRAEIFLHCRKDFPLPPPINRGGFDGLREEKIGSKISQKISSFPVSAIFSLFFFLSYSTSSTAAFSHENTNTPGLHTTTNTSSTIGSRHDHQAATATPFLSPADLFHPPPFSATATSTVAAEAGTTSSRGFHP